jgi:hypothetical protein
VCPVSAAQGIIRKDLNDPVVADSPTVFPTSEMEALSHRFPDWASSPDLINGWNGVFVPIFEG